MSGASPRPPIPGPHARAVVETLARWGSTVTTPPYPLVVQRAWGCWVEDADGNRWLDCNGAGGTCLAGHCHPTVVRAVREQAGELLHVGIAEGYHPKHAQLAERLAGLGAARGTDLRAVVGQSGSEAVRAAIDLARHHTGRDATIAFVASLHAPDLDGVSMPTSKLIERSGLGPLVSGMHHASFPDPLRQGIEATSNALEDILTILGKVVTPDAVAAMLVEPVQTEGGYLVPPDQFLQALRRLCDQHGMLLIANEIHTGLGRTGRMFGWRHSGVEPDIVCLAGGLAGGLPLGAIVARAELLQWPSHSRASTFGANPLSCAASLATLDLLDDELLEQGDRAGERLLEALREALADVPVVGEVRGKGLLLAVELVHDKERLEPHASLRDEVVMRCFDRGLLVRSIGPSAIAITPPLCISDAEVELVVTLLTHAITESDAPLPDLGAVADRAQLRHAEAMVAASVGPLEAVAPSSPPPRTARAAPSSAPPGSRAAPPSPARGARAPGAKPAGARKAVSGKAAAKPKKTATGKTKTAAKPKPAAGKTKTAAKPKPAAGKTKTAAKPKKTGSRTSPRAASTSKPRVRKAKRR